MARSPIVTQYDYSQDPGSSITGPFLAGAPGSNMLIPRPQLTAMAGAGNISFTLNLAAARLIGLIYMLNLVADSAASISVSAGGYSVTTTCSPADLSGLYDPIEWVGLGRPRFFVPPAPVSAGVVNVSITGSGTPIQIGYMGVASIWQAPIGMAFGESITVQDISDVQRVPFGSSYIVHRGKVRRLSMGFGFLRQDGIYGTGTGDEVFSGPLKVAVINGKSSPIAAVPFPDDPYHIERQSVAGFTTNDQQFANEQFATWNTQFQIDQMI
jgi:hypothetical protein